MHHAAAWAATLAFTLLLGTGPSPASEKLVYGIFPPEELEGASQGHGNVTPQGFLALEAAISDLRAHGIDFDKFSSASVWEYTNSFSVYFSDQPVGSVLNDDRQPPAGGKTAIYRIDKHTFAVLGSVY